MRMENIRTMYERGIPDTLSRFSQYSRKIEDKKEMRPETDRGTFRPHVALIILTRYCNLRNDLAPLLVHESSMLVRRGILSRFSTSRRKINGIIGRSAENAKFPRTK